MFVFTTIIRRSASGCISHGSQHRILSSCGVFKFTIRQGPLRRTGSNQDEIYPLIRVRNQIKEDLLSEIIDALEDDPIEGLAELLETMEDLDIECADYSDADVREATADAAAEFAKVAKYIAGGKDLKLAGVDEFMEDNVEAVGDEYSRK